jgi:hypothetical protein
MEGMLKLVNRTTRVQVLGTSLGAVHNSMATIELVGIVQILQTLLSVLITRISNPTVGLLKDRRAKVLIRMPPVGRTRGRTTSTKNTLVQTIKKLTVFIGLKILNFVVGIDLRLLLEPRLDGSVLLVEVGHIYTFDDTKNTIPATKSLMTYI